MGERPQDVVCLACTAQAIAVLCLESDWLVLENCRYKLLQFCAWRVINCMYVPLMLASCCEVLPCQELLESCHLFFEVNKLECGEAGVESFTVSQKHVFY